MQHYLIELFITLVGSCLGVLGAFLFDNVMDLNNHERKKTNLIKALIAELKDIKKYIEDIKTLQSYQSYSLEPLVLDTTIQAQINYIENIDLIIGLSILGSFFKRAHIRFERLDLIRTQQSANAGAKFDSEIKAISDNWIVMRQKGLEHLAIILPLLEKELTT